MPSPEQPLIAPIPTDNILTMLCESEFAAAELAWRVKTLQDKTYASHQTLPEISPKQKKTAG